MCRNRGVGRRALPQETRCIVGDAGVVSSARRLVREGLGGVSRSPGLHKGNPPGTPRMPAAPPAAQHPRFTQRRTAYLEALARGPVSSPGAPCRAGDPHGLKAS